MEVLPLDTLPIDVLVRAWNGVYGDYAVPMTRDAGQLRAHVEAGSIDLRRSRVWCDGEEPVGLSLLGVRGDRGWVGGFGVVPGHRGAGLASRMIRDQLEVAAGAGLARVGLEVLAGNPARHVYERAGFETTRLLHVLSGTLQGVATGDTWSGAFSVSTAARLEELLTGPAPWGREAAHLAAEGALVVGAGDPASPGAVLVLREGPTGWSLLAGAAATPADADDVVGRLAAELDGAVVRVVNEPDGSPLLSAFEAAGAERTLTQHEMAVSVAASS